MILLNLENRVYPLLNVREVVKLQAEVDDLLYPDTEIKVIPRRAGLFQHSGLERLLFSLFALKNQYKGNTDLGTLELEAIQELTQYIPIVCVQTLFVRWVHDTATLDIREKYMSSQRFNALDTSNTVMETGVYSLDSANSFLQFVASKPERTELNPEHQDVVEGEELTVLSSYLISFASVVRQIQEILPENMQYEPEENLSILDRLGGNAKLKELMQTQMPNVSRAKGSIDDILGRKQPAAK